MDKENAKAIDSLHKRFNTPKPKPGDAYTPDISQRHPMLRGKYLKDSHGIKSKALKAKIKSK